MRLRGLAVVAMLALACAPPASAQIFGGGRQDRQIEALQRDVGAIQLQLNGANGQPGLAGARAEITRLNERVEDLEQSLRTMNGTVENLTTELTAARRANEATDERNRDLSERVTRLETAISTLREQVAQAAAPAPNADEPAATEGGDEPAPPTRPATPDGQFDAARAQNADPQAAEAAWSAFIAANPRDPRIGQANHFLGEARFARQQWQGAAAAYAASLRGFPQASWAAESALKLADALARLNNTAQACAALNEFDARYAAGASARGRQRAAQARQRLSCA